jgi:hypothetical protein
MELWPPFSIAILNFSGTVLTANSLITVGLSLQKPTQRWVVIHPAIVVSVLTMASG